MESITEYTDTQRLDWFLRNKNNIMFDTRCQKWTINWGSLGGQDMFDTPREAIDVAMQRRAAEAKQGR